MRIPLQYATGKRPIIAMPHNAATGVSGVDLYAKPVMDWRWIQRKYSFFGYDTIPLFQHTILKEKYHEKGREYQLYLPCTMSGVVGNWISSRCCF